MSDRNCGCSETTVHYDNCNQCPPEPCACPIADLSTDCIVLTISDPLPCSGVENGTILTEAIQQIDAHICTAIEQINGSINLISVGDGAEVYKGINGVGKREIKSILGSDLITVNNLTNEVEITVNESALSAFIGDADTYSVSNIGTGASIYKDSTVVGVNTQFNLRKIVSTNSSVTITEGTDDIDLTVVVDTVITDSSQNPITSNAVFDALAAGTVETKKEYIVIPLSDLTTNLTTGNTKAYFRMPFAATINSVRASVLVAQTAGSILTFDINEGGTSILSTKLTIDNNEKTSLTATTPVVISDTSLADDAEITFDIDQVGTVGAKGAVITLLVTRV